MPSNLPGILPRFRKNSMEQFSEKKENSMFGHHCQFPGNGLRLYPMKFSFLSALHVKSYYFETELSILKQQQIKTSMNWLLKSSGSEMVLHTILRGLTQNWMRPSSIVWTSTQRCNVLVQLPGNSITLSSGENLEAADGVWGQLCGPPPLLCTTRSMSPSDSAHITYLPVSTGFSEHW